MREQFTYFWEILSGVQTDNTAKAIRAVCLLVMLAGIAWVAMSYINATRISDMSIDMDIPFRAITQNPHELDRVAALAESVSNMRTNGERLASEMTNMNRRLFNIDALNIPGMTEEYVPGIGLEIVPQEVMPEVNVKAVMLTSREGYAVVSVGSKREHQGLIVRRGYELPEGVGKITRIKTDGITVRRNGEEIDYMIK